MVSGLGCHFVGEVTPLPRNPTEQRAVSDFCRLEMGPAELASLYVVARRLGPTTRATRISATEHRHGEGEGKRDRSPKPEEDVERLVTQPSAARTRSEPGAAPNRS